MTQATLSRHKGVFVTATDTGVGKTFVGARIVRTMTEAGLKVAARKPAESGCEVEQDRLIPADATLLWEASGAREALEQVCPYRFLHALSPSRAAALEGKELRLAQLLAAAQPDPAGEFLVVEGAGGFFSPIADDGLNADLAAALGLPVLLVVPDRLGGINQALLGINAIEQRGLQVAAVVLNQGAQAQDPALDNAAELRPYCTLPLFRVNQNADASDEVFWQIARVLIAANSGE